MRTPLIAPVPASHITPEHIWRDRRRYLKAAGIASASALLAPLFPMVPAQARSQADGSLAYQPSDTYTLDERWTSEADVTSYNNFFEFGTGKADPKKYASRLQTEPWTVRIDGEVERARTLDIDALRQLASLEERVYRLRCVEGWSMVIPWIGYSLSSLLATVQPTSNAKYVEFTSVTQAENMPGLSSKILPWPYTEGLTLEEAMHPLTMLVFGVYGKTLPEQNGAPVRLIVPWKYGFKSAKSIVAIRLLREPPITTWPKVAPKEYGFYANVNPDVAHPRWSQSTERRIGESLFAPRVPTQLFNGYAEQVAHLYAGMDLSQHF